MNSGFLKHLRSMGLSMRCVECDGNCFFRALSVQMYGNEGRHDNLRKVVCDYMETHEGDLAPFFADTDIPYQAHVTKMRVLGEWAGNLEIYVATIVIGRDIRIYHQDLRTQDISSNNGRSPLVLLSYHSDPGHYNSVHLRRRDNDIKTSSRANGNVDGRGGTGKKAVAMEKGV